MLATGAFTFTRPLLSLSAIGGISFSFSIDYLADEGIDDVLGKGMNFPQNLHLEQSGDDVVLVTGGNVHERFEQVNGQYEAADNNNTRATLTKEGSGSGEEFVMTSSKGTVTRFYGFDAAIDTPGRVKSIKDHYGDEQTYVWQEEGGRHELVSVTDAYGRSIAFTYYGSSEDYRLKEIEDFLGRKLNFQYDQHGHLVAVVLPSITEGADSDSNTFPGGTGYVFEYDVNNSREERRDDLIRIWYPNEVAAHLDETTRTVDVAAVYANAKPRYVVAYGQDPTDEDHWGRAISETIGDPANGVGGTIYYTYTIADLPNNLIDPNDPIVFRTVVTDRNDNQTIYDFNAAQMPVRVERIATRNKNSLQDASWITWTKYNQHNQPVEKVLPEGNSIEYVHENGQIGGISGVYNRRVGLRIQETHKPGNDIGIPSRPGSNGQEVLTRRFVYDPIFAQRCAVIEQRGNPIDEAGNYFTPQNGGTTPTDTDRSRYATITYFDYQQNQASTVTGDSDLQTLLGLSASEIQALIDHVDQQMKDAGLPDGFQMDLGDLNGDCRGDGDSSGLPAAKILGNRVKVKHPSVRLIGSSSITTQDRVEIFTVNDRGQVTTRTDPEGNVTAYVRYPFSDPDGDGQHTVPGNGNKQYGRMKEIHVDVDPDDVMDLIGADGDLDDFSLMVTRTNTPGEYQDLVTKYEGGGSGGCASCAYDPLGNPLAVTDPRGFTTRWKRNEMGEAYQTISPEPYEYKTETFYDANRNATRVDIEDVVVDYDSSDPSSPDYAKFTPTGSGSSAQLPTKAGPGGSVRTGWFTDLYTYNLLDKRTEEDRDATGSSPSNLVTEFKYDENTNLIKIIKPDGNTVEFDHDERNLRIARRVGYDPANGEDGAVTVWVFDGNRNLIKTIGPEEYPGEDGIRCTATIADAFHGSSDLTHTGTCTETVYDGFNRVIERIDPRDNPTEYSHDPTGRVIETIRKGTVDGNYSGSRVELARSVTRFDEAGRAYERQQDVFLATGTTLPSGRTVTHTGGGLAINSTNDDHDATVTLTSGESSYVLNRTVYDRAGRAVEQVADNTAVTQMAYDGANRMIEQVDALGNTVALVHDGNGNVVETTRTETCTITQPSVDDEVFRSATRYDCLNRPIVHISQGADGTFDADVTIDWPSTSETLFSLTGYDSRNNRTNTIDAKGNTAVTVFDGASRAIETIEHLRVDGQGDNGPLAGKTFTPSGGSCIVTQSEHDANSRVTKLIDDRGGTTSYSFDTLDREIEMEFHDGAKRLYAYNAASDLTEYADENGSVFDHSYDTLGRRIATAITRASGVVGTTSLSATFDGLSRPLLMRDSVNTTDADINHVHDALGRIVEYSQTYDGNTHHVTHTAFTSNVPTQVTYPDGREVDSVYDDLYRRSGVSDSAGSIADWQFFGPGRVAEVERGNGIIETFMNNDRTHSAVQESVANPGWGSADSDRLGYDGAGRMIAKRFLAGGIDSSTHAYDDTDPVAGFTTAFDRASDKLYERELHAESRSHLYEEFVSGDPQGGHDSLDRLRQYQRGELASGGGAISTAISLPNTDEQRDYILDGLGNWKETDYVPVGGSLVEETRNHNKLNQITKRQPDDGDPWTNFTHDANGNLTDDGVRTYEWDALNRLYEVKRKSDGKTIAEYVYNAATHRIRKTVSNGGISGNVPNGETNFVYNTAWQCLEERDGSDALLRQYVWGTYIDELLQMRDVSNDRYPLQDLLYRTTALTDDIGSIVETYDTDAYGNTLIFDAPGTGGDWWADDASQADVPTCAFIFTGRRYDPETELYQYRHRYYAPVWGRFISRDTLPLRMDNHYGYGSGQPVRMLDSLGLESTDAQGQPTPGASELGKEGDLCCLSVQHYWEVHYESKWECYWKMLEAYTLNGLTGGISGGAGILSAKAPLAFGVIGAATFGYTAGVASILEGICQSEECASWGSWYCVSRRTTETWSFGPFGGGGCTVCDEWACQGKLPQNYVP